jgi:hypothetical protein
MQPGPKLVDSCTKAYGQTSLARYNCKLLLRTEQDFRHYNCYLPSGCLVAFLVKPLPLQPCGYAPKGLNRRFAQGMIRAERAVGNGVGIFWASFGKFNRAVGSPRLSQTLGLKCFLRKLQRNYERCEV